MDERTMRNLNLGFRFILEMAVLLGLFLWGYSLSDQTIVQLVLGLGAALLAMVVWGLLVAPRAKRRLPDPARLVVELAVFGAGVLAYVFSGNFFVGILLGTAAVISLALMFYWDQRAY